MYLKNKISYQAVLKYLCVFALFLLFAKLESTVLPYNSAILVASLYLGCNLIITPVLYLCSFLVLGKVGLLGAGGVTVLVFFIISLIYHKVKRKPIFLYSAFTAIAMLGFVLLGDNTTTIIIEKRFFVAVATTFLALLCCISGRVICEKGLNFKLDIDEYLSVAFVLVVIGVGVCNLVSPYVWKGLCAFILLIFCFVSPSASSLLISALTGVSLSVYYGNVNYVSTLLVWGLAVYSLMPVSRYLSASALIMSDCVCQLVFSVYGEYLIADFLPIIVASAIFCMIPTKPLLLIKERLSLFKDKQLARQAINRNRLMLSNRLYELSSVFTEMSAAFNTFKLNDLSPTEAKTVITRQILDTVCEGCPANQKGSCTRKKRTDGIERMIDIGFAKGKLSFIDMPKIIADSCAKATEIIYCANKLLADYRNYSIDKANVAGGRELLSQEADGIAEILRGLALETGTLLSFQKKTEKLLSDSLLKSGFLISELLVYGDGDRLSISLIITMKEYSLERLQRVISNTLNKPMILCDKANVTDEKTYLVFKIKCTYDAVFGIAKVDKFGSEISGDTHSVARISDDKFLVALSDGMGSGEKAERVSATALSLIECFYRAGLNSDLILRTVNKLLAINSEDSFTALDVCIIDLKTCSADFIKYGSPYGFIVGENGVKIVEGNSLPLGILDELKPSVCTTSLENENMLLMVTDGISDAFGQADEIIDYLRSVPALNPQTLADGVLKRALELSNGKPADDMTVLAVRVFKKAL